MSEATSHSLDVLLYKVIKQQIRTRHKHSLHVLLTQRVVEVLINTSMDLTGDRHDLPLHFIILLSLSNILIVESRWLVSVLVKDVASHVIGKLEV